MGTLTHERAVEMFHEQAEGLKAGGADVLWVETISAARGVPRRRRGCALAGMPWCGTMSFDTAGRTMMGLTSAAMVALVERLPNPPIAFGANCGVGAVGSDAHHARLCRGRAPSGRSSPRAMPASRNTTTGHIHYDGTPELMADYAVLARDAGCAIIGGCCGTMPEHLRRDARSAGNPAARAAPDARRDHRTARRLFLGARTGPGTSRRCARAPRPAPGLRPGAGADGPRTPRGYFRNEENRGRSHGRWLFRKG